VVSDFENERVRPQRRNLAAHRAVLNGLMAVEEAVLPMRFGTIAANASEIKSLLATNRKEFEIQLRQIAGKLEMGVGWSGTSPTSSNISSMRIPICLKEARDRLFGGASQPSQNDRIELGRMFERLREADRLAIARR
jgi:hypothetical protein